MARAVTNYPEVAAVVSQLGHLLDLDRYGPHGPLAETLLDVIAVDIHARSRQQKGPSGKSWSPNRGPYGKRKRDRNIPVGIGWYGDGAPPGGEMLSLRQIRGTRVYHASDAEMTYGLDDETQQKAEWFQDPEDPAVQPRREFYDVDDQGERRIEDAVAAALEEWFTWLA